MGNETLQTDPADAELALPYVGLRGRELVSWALESGPGCVRDLGSSQVRYFGAICVRQGIKWPKEFFESSVDELMGRC